MGVWLCVLDLLSVLPRLVISQFRFSQAVSVHVRCVQSGVLCRAVLCCVAVLHWLLQCGIERDACSGRQSVVVCIGRGMKGGRMWQSPVRPAPATPTK